MDDSVVVLQVDFDAILTASTVREFDSLAIVPQFGFKDVDDYYSQASPLQYAHRITVPTLAINAVDDPVCAHDGCPEGDRIGPGLAMVRTRIGTLAACMHLQCKPLENNHPLD
eukprot:m.59753 g.59753  ORF g.59753 m.59753 type:complete len:113 (-) comp13823_c0_seq5:167-505(-)